MRHEKFGVYLNTGQLKAVRVKSLPLDTSGIEWILVTSDVNAALVSIRELA